MGKDVDNDRQIEKNKELNKDMRERKFKEEKRKEGRKGAGWVQIKEKNKLGHCS